MGIKKMDESTTLIDLTSYDNNDRVIVLLHTILFNEEGDDDRINSLMNKTLTNEERHELPERCKKLHLNKLNLMADLMGEPKATAKNKPEFVEKVCVFLGECFGETTEGEGDIQGQEIVAEVQSEEILANGEAVVTEETVLGEEGEIVDEFQQKLYARAARFGLPDKSDSKTTKDKYKRI